MSQPATPLSHHLLKAVLSATLVPLLLMVALGLWQYDRDVAQIESFTGSESVSAAGVVANFLTFLVDDTSSLLRRMAREVEAGRVTEALLKREGDAQLQTEGLEVTDAQGIIRISTIGQRGRDVSKLTYFLDARRGAAVAYSDVFHSQWLGQQVVMMALPYRQHGVFGGVVMARLNLKMLHQILAERLADPALRSTFVVDRQGTLLSHSDHARVESGQNVGDMPAVRAGLAGRTGWLKSPTPGDGADIHGYVPMRGTGWVVVATRKAGDTLLQVDQRLRDQLVLSGLAALAVGVGALVWGRRLSQPVEGLAGTMRLGLGTGFQATDLPTVVRPPTAIAEYETLTACYNAMVTELNRRFSEILSLQDALQARNKALRAQNDELAALSAQADASNRLKSQFLATMSHELRTPLNSIIGFTELVLTERGLDLTEQGRSNLQMVARSGRHLLTLINGVLDLAKIEAGRTSAFVEPFDPREMIAEVLGTLEPQARERNLALAAELSSELGLIHSDETKVRQIVLNLTGNALKFTQAGGVTVTTRPVGADRWAVEVADTGVGIAPEHQALIFEEFRQVDGTTTRTSGGTGLGLSIARKLAHLLGGDITLTSEAGRGSTFTLELPRRSEVTEAQACVPHTAVGGGQAAEGPSETRLVVTVDDDPQSTYLITELLKGSPFTAVPAASGEEGVRLTRELKPAAVTLDVKIRRQDDWKTLRALKADPRTADVPIIVLCFEDQKPLAYALGAAAFLTKPVDRHQLLSILERRHEVKP